MTDLTALRSAGAARPRAERGRHPPCRPDAAHLGRQRRRPTSPRDGRAWGRVRRRGSRPQARPSASRSHHRGRRPGRLAVGDGRRPGRADRARRPPPRGRWRATAAPPSGDLQRSRGDPRRLGRLRPGDARRASHRGPRHGRIVSTRTRAEQRTDEYTQIDLEPRGYAAPPNHRSRPHRGLHHVACRHPADAGRGRGVHRGAFTPCLGASVRLHPRHRGGADLQLLLRRRLENPSGERRAPGLYRVPGLGRGR